MGPRPHLSFRACTTAWLAAELLVSMGPIRHLWFLDANSDFWTRITSLYGSQTWSVILCMKNSVISNRKTSLYGTQPSSVFFACKIETFGPWITSLYESQTSPVILCMLNRVIRIRITSFYVAQPSSLVFARITASFGPELQVSMGPRPHLSFCVCKTAWVAPELLVSIGPSRHLWFLLEKQRLLDQNYKSLWVLDLTCRFVDAKQRD